MPNTLIYKDQGGSTLTVESGATLDVQAGASFKRAGFIPLPLQEAVILSANAVQNLTEGGRADGNSSPSLSRVNGATDIALLLTWAAGASEEIQWSVPLPPDLDDASTISVCLWIEKSSNTDTAAVVAVKMFQGKGDTNAGGNTAALATATGTLYTVTMAASDVLAASAAPFLNVALVPGTHANDGIRIYAAYITYRTA
jgi:hypothetical protein